MDGYEWDDSMETGDPLVDRQHREIHLLVDYVESAQSDPHALMPVLAALMEHVDCHFATEEALMERTGYAGEAAEAHIAEHHKLKDEARDVVLRFRNGELTEMDPVVEFLRAWLRDHVHDRDREFIEYVRARGELASLPEPWASNPPDLNGLVA